MAFHSKGGGIKGKFGCGQDTDGDLHIINQLRKIIDMDMPMKVRFKDNSKVIVDFPIASSILEYYDRLKPFAKEAMAIELWRNGENFQKIYNDKYKNNNNKELSPWDNGV
jgi:hypothetical protein